MIGPPTDIAPGRLFRLLIERAPRWPLQYRFPFAPDAALYARALSPSERRAVVDAPNRDAALIATALCDEDGASCLTQADVRLLLPAEGAALLREVVDALRRIAPTHAAHNADAWRRRLRLGIEDNVFDAFTLGGCVDVSYGARGARCTTPRPERFWGCAVSDLTEAQWLVYGVCREFRDRMSKEAEHG